MAGVKDRTGGIGLLGGTFDPVHLGHIAISREVKEHFKLERVAIIPAFRNPLRTHEEIVAGTNERLIMAHLATLEDPWLFVDPIEIETGRHRPGPSYTIDTLRRYANHYPGMPLTLIVGADNVAFHQWKDAEQFPEYLYRIAVVARPEFEVALAQNMMEVGKHHPQVADLVEFLPLVNIPLSSTQVRLALHNQEMPEDSIHPAVEVFIRKYGLYGWKEG
ncbi:MAG TPA: nicotinate (nicotinamide) nucleotide adenylyltransferase [Firmicutes bacterium]|mgnify:CR=1 FL=1|nr:nicotinate (nicotinamide) nucleotide adenylyltransferase [Bacillota bacterium]